MAENKYPKLHIFTTGKYAEEMEKLLNYYHNGDENIPSKPLGIFQWKIKESLKKFQKEEDLPVTGISDKLTWKILRGERGTTDYDFRNNINPRGQQTTSTCWRSATAMLLGKLETEIGNGTAKFSSDMAVAMSKDNLKLFAKEQGLKMVDGAGIKAANLAFLIKNHSCLMLAILDDFYRDTMGNQDSHFIILARMRGISGDWKSDETALMAFDPMPLNTGSSIRASHTNLGKWIRYIFYK